MPQTPTLNSRTITYEQLAKTIDHSLLRPELTEADVVAGCTLAAQYHVASVCVKPCHAWPKNCWPTTSPWRRRRFPHGNSTMATKVFETQSHAGATEIDMVINIGADRPRGLRPQ
jgi:deoxyribose-phosphate aldolase